MKKAFFTVFAGLSLICMSIEMIELFGNVSFAYSDHLHNFLDHIALIMLNYIGLHVTKVNK